MNAETLNFLYNVFKDKFQKANMSLEDLKKEFGDDNGEKNISQSEAIKNMSELIQKFEDEKGEKDEEDTQQSSVIEDLETMFKQEVDDINDFAADIAKGRSDATYCFDMRLFKEKFEAILWTKEEIDRIIYWCGEMLEEFHDIMYEMREKDQVLGIKGVLELVLTKEPTCDQEKEIQQMLEEYFSDEEDEDTDDE